MKIEIVQEEQEIHVPSIKFVDVKYYISDDGRVKSKHQKEVKQYEEKLLFNKLVILDLKNFEYDHLIKLETSKDVDIFFSHYYDYAFDYNYSKRYDYEIAKVKKVISTAVLAGNNYFLYRESKIDTDYQFGNDTYCIHLISVNEYINNAETVLKSIHQIIKENKKD